MSLLEKSRYLELGRKVQIFWAILFELLRNYDNLGCRHKQIHFWPFLRLFDMKSAAFN